jgi:hypothetical protein
MVLEEHYYHHGDDLSDRGLLLSAGGNAAIPRKNLVVTLERSGPNLTGRFALPTNTDTHAVQAQPVYVSTLQRLLLLWLNTSWKHGKYQRAATALDLATLTQALIGKKIVESDAVVTFGSRSK